MTKQRILLLALVLLTIVTPGRAVEHPAYNGTLTEKNCPGLYADGKHDDTEALNACLAALPDHGRLRLSSGALIAISGTIHLRNGFAKSIVAESTPMQSAGPGIGPGLVWIGAAHGGPMLKIDRMHGGSVEGLTLWPKAVCNATGNYADVGIVVDQCDPGSSTVMTGFTFRHVNVMLCGVDNPSFVGLSFSPVSKNNVENMAIEDSLFQCSGTSKRLGIGVRMGPSFNQKGFLFQRSTFVRCEHGVEIGGGTPNFYSNTFQSNHVAIYDWAHTDAIAVIGSDGENNDIFYDGASIGPTILESNRIANSHPPAGQGIINMDHGTVIMTGNNFALQAEPALIMHCVDEAGLVSTGNILFNDFGLGNTGWADCQSDTISLGDKWRGRAGGVHAMGLSMSGSYKGRTNAYLLPLKTPRLGSMYFDADLQKWLVTENGSAFRPIAPFVQTKAPPCVTAPDDIGRVWLDTTTNTTVYKVCQSTAGVMGWVAH